mmetsp:Transcript_11105/g.17516  ORF Transcript_11105/g.17516 Transcript_11105/m.17516 type:complete len:577 (+) Transcript_11105:2-1732(+)
MNSSNISTRSVKKSKGGQIPQNHILPISSVGKAVKTQPQPRASNHKSLGRETRPLQKKSMELQKGITISAPSPMTLDRVQVQMGQEHSAPESKEYRQHQSDIKLKQEVELKKALHAQAKEEAKQRIREEAQRKRGEGFEAELQDFSLDNEVGKKKSLVKKILGKIRPKSPRKKGQDTGDNPTAPRNGPLNAEEARSLARRALKANRQKVPSFPLNPVPLDRADSACHPAPMPEVLMTKQEDSVSDLDASTRKFPVNEILMNDRDQVRDDESVSTLGTPQVFIRHPYTALGRSRKSDIRDPTPTDGIDGTKQPSRHNREPDGALYRRAEPAESEREPMGDSRLLHRNGQALIDQVDSISAWSVPAENSAVTDGTEAIEMRLGGCDPNGIATAPKNPSLGLLAKPKSGDLDYTFSGFCVGRQSNEQTRSHSTSERANVEDLVVNVGLHDVAQSGTEEVESEHGTKNESMPTAAQTMSSGEDVGIQPDKRPSQAEPLSPTSAFSSAIDAAIRQVETEMRGRDSGPPNADPESENDTGMRREGPTSTEPLPGSDMEEKKKNWQFRRRRHSKDAEKRKQTH